MTDLADLKEKAMAASLRFVAACEAMRDVQSRLEQGQQFNEWGTGRGSPFVGIGPISNLMSLVETEDAETAELLASALKSAVLTSALIARVEALEGAAREACDLLAERKYGSHARSPGHNARLELEAALSTEGERG